MAVRKPAVLDANQADYWAMKLVTGLPARELDRSPKKPRKRLRGAAPRKRRLTVGRSTPLG